MPPNHPCHTHNAPSAQKAKEKKKAKYDSLQDLRKNKKELEFEQKLYKEKEEMLEKEKQLKINRLAQEVCALPRDTAHGPSKLPCGIVLHRWSLKTELFSLPVQRVRRL